MTHMQTSAHEAIARITAELVTLRELTQQPVGPALRDRLMADDFVRTVHETNGLLDALRDSASASTVPELGDMEQSLLALVESTGDPESSVQLAGSAGRSRR